MLVSTKVLTFSYIGETINMHARLYQHNLGYGSNTNIPVSLRPYALFAYLCVFEVNGTLRRSFEESWKHIRDEERMRGVTDLKQIARLASGVIHQTEMLQDINLRLILNFEE